MRNIVTLIIVVALAAYGVSQYRKTARAAQAAAAEPEVEYREPMTQAVKRDSTAPSFHCDGRQHCSQMASCEEAKYFLRNCPGVKMDGDHDGVPCEEQHCRWR